MSGEGNKDSRSIGFDIGWSNSGVSAGIRSRLATTLDHFLGRKVEEKGMGTDRTVRVFNAVTKAQEDLSETATRTLARALENDPAKAAAYLSSLATGERRFDNLASCLGLAIEGVRGGSTTHLDDTAEVSPDMLNRWQGYAEGASTDQLRERWARVLTEEIRKPGTFSMKTMRVVDELDPETARLFEQLCTIRTGPWVPYAVRLLNRHKMDALRLAGLLVQQEDRGIIFRSTQVASGETLLAYFTDRFLLGVESHDKLIGSLFESGDFLLTSDKNISTRVAVLTPEGEAIASIMPSPGDKPMLTLAAFMQKHAEEGAIRFFEKDEQGEWHPVDDWLSRAEAN